MSKNLIIIDNYDSFTHNLYQQFAYLSQAKVTVFRNDQVTIDQLEQLAPAGLIFSPGPGGPNDTGISRKALEIFLGKIPILGVCLGQQLIADYFGASVKRAKVAMHGKTSLIENNGKNLFLGLPNKFEVARYHSLAVYDLRSDLEIDAWTLDNNENMAISHKQLPIWGVQFHPESFLTEFGDQLVKNYIKKCLI